MRLGGSSPNASLNLERQGEGEPLLLLHGIGGELCVWEPVLDALSERAAVIAVALPGFGRSPALPAGVAPTPGAIAGAVARLLDELEIESAHRRQLARRLDRPRARQDPSGAVGHRPVPSGAVGGSAAPGGSLRPRGRAADRPPLLRPLLPLLMLSRRARRLALSPTWSPTPTACLAPPPGGW